jgi:hypothetical protein
MGWGDGPWGFDEQMVMGKDHIHDHLSPFYKLSIEHGISRILCIAKSIR